MAQQIKTALVVDDSRLARVALGKLLKNRGIDVDMATSGTEALEYLRGTRPDIVFMDYMMPDMDGFEAARLVLTDPACRQPPVVMYTSQDTEEDRAKARELGVAGFLGKPADQRALDAVLARLAAQPVPATAPAPAGGPERVDLEGARIAAGEAAEEVARRYLDQLRQEMADELGNIVRQATTAAEQRATAAVDAAAQRISAQGPMGQAELEARVRQLAEKRAERVAADIAREAGAAAARALLPQLVEEARRVALDSVDDNELQQRLRSMVEQGAIPLLRRELLPAAQQAAEAALQAELESRVAALEEQLQETAQLFAATEVAAMRGALLGKAVAAGVAAGLIAGFAAGLLF